MSDTDSEHVCYRADEDGERHSAEELLALIRPQPLEVNLFRGESRDIGTPRVFGGQVLAQALLAASETVEPGRLAHSLHAYFLRAGDPESPIVYSVDRSRDGRSFSARRVVAIQHGQQIFTLSASFQVPQGGVDHQFDMPDVPGPDDIVPGEALSPERLEQVSRKLHRWFNRFGPYEIRPVDIYDPFRPEPRPPRQRVWFRINGDVGDDPVLNRALLAYVSDFHLVSTATLPHGISLLKGNVLMASLDHAMWFHRECRLDDWLLYDCDSPNAGGSRGLARGMIYDRQGRLVASTAQEGMIRVVEPPGGGDVP
ncbi:acyl-CoA thioesterase II [Marinihelvus fidelis]|uniref:Acyl-CoA thioesterase 2 n=1 Tax=Marinihelvus fidelis TaxID=2613842 RepID=A0A5N0TDK4_9GAMM|nr:acyl-CoA thioesterase II [Marinihelvus fidelis]KAA9133173.1 acyl-CoA thioesterase II [Marinihelvus fidelis]